MKIVHVITCLDDGGAEAILFRLIQRSLDDEHFVVSLRGYGKYAILLEGLGVKVFNIELNISFKIFSALCKLSKIIKTIKPDAVQTWMYHADLIGGLVARIVGCRNVIWGIHNSTVSARKNTVSRFLLIRINALVSWVVPRMIISCSKDALDSHSGIGYCSRKLLFIPNGHPVDMFYPNERARVKIRSELGVSEEIVLLGMVARFDPQKDHINLLNALELLKKHKVFKCVLVGKGLDQQSSLMPEIQMRGLSDDIFLIGQRADIPQIMNALDFLIVSSSYSEAFPNVLCEAMACETLCITTNVGDSAYIVDDTGWVVPPRQPDRLAKALIDAMSSAPDFVRKTAARQRIVDNFSIEKMVASYRWVWSCCIQP